MRQRGASIFIYLIFGLLILIFVINFAPKGGQGGGGCRGVSNVVVDVDGSPASKTAYHVAYSNPQNDDTGRRKVYGALETLIRRELLASAAEQRGIRVTRDMVDEEIKKGFFFVGGERMQLGNYIFDQHDDGTKTWSLRKFKGWVQSLDVSQTSYLDEQVRGLQATLMAELLASSAQVSRDEALSDYLFDHNTVAYDVVTFSPAAYRGAMLLTDADTERFLAAHEDEVKARFKDREREYTDRKAELKLREIFIAKAEPDAPPAGDAAKPDEKKADAKAGDAAKPAKPAGTTIEEAKAKLEAARASVESGKAKFADLAKQLHTDPVKKANAGALGWKTADNAGIGEKAVSDAVKTLKPGDMTPVITTDRGAYLVIVEDKREGKLTYDQVKQELAAELAREVWSKEAAKRDALKALEAARASKKNLADLYEREQAPAQPGRPDFQKLLNDPGIPEELKQKIREQIIRGELGALEIESDDVLAASKTEEAAGGSAGAAGSAVAPAPAPAAGAGSAAAPAAPAAAAPAAPAPAAPKAEPLAASTDVLPAFAEMPKPKVRKEGPTPRQKRMPALGDDGAKVVFDQLEKDQLADRVFESDGNYTLVQLVEKDQAKMDEFDKEADQIMAGMRAIRGQRLVLDFLKARCEELDKAGKIKPMRELITETDDKGKPAPTVYRPCMSLR